MEEVRLLALWVAVEKAEVVVVGVVASRQRVDTALDLTSTDLTPYRQLDHLAEVLPLVAAAAAAAVDIAADPTILTLLDLDPDHQDPDDGVEAEVMEQIDVMITIPDDRSTGRN